MVDVNKNIPIFSSQCFWDMDYTKLDFNNDRNFIIERVVSRGGSKDEVELFRYYGREVIKEEVVKIRYLNDKVFNYLSILLGISKQHFRCYNNRGIF